MEALIYLTYLGIILLLGLLLTILAKLIKIPNILLLIFLGIALNQIHYQGAPLISFPIIFLTSISILALVLVVFDAASRFKIKEFDTFSLQALKLVFFFLIFNLIFLTLFTMLLFSEIQSFWLALLFAALMSGTDTVVALATLKENKSRVAELLEIESILNTPFVIVITFIIIDLMTSLQPELIVSQFIEQIGPFLQQIITGIGAGVLVGLLILKIMKRWYSETLSPLALITAALLTYILAENLGGSGVLAVTVTGLFFGNIYLKEKQSLYEFSTIFANSLEILVFVLVGLVISIPLSVTFFVKALVLFILYLMIRFFTIHTCFLKSKYTLKEKIFMTLNVSKGISVAVITFTLTTLGIPTIDPVLHLSLIFVIISIIIPTVLMPFSSYFIPPKLKEAKKHD